MVIVIVEVPDGVMTDGGARVVLPASQPVT
jgi:hypothetical protein